VKLHALSPRRLLEMMSSLAIMIVISGCTTAFLGGAS
jgi:hypothetical protein